MVTKEEAYVLRFLETWDFNESLFVSIEDVYQGGFGSPDFRVLWPLYYAEWNPTTGPLRGFNQIIFDLGMDIMPAYGFFGVYEALDTIALNTRGDVESWATLPKSDFVVISAVLQDEITPTGP